MTIQELKQTDWYKGRPLIIQKAIDKLPPTSLYRFKESGKQCRLIGYQEPNDKSKEVTVRVQKTGVGGFMAMVGLESLDTCQVFDVKLTDLEQWKD